MPKVEQSVEEQSKAAEKKAKASDTAKKPAVKKTKAKAATKATKVAKAPKAAAKKPAAAKAKSAASATKSAAKAKAPAKATKNVAATDAKSSYLRLRLRAFDSRLLDRAATQIAERAIENGATVKGPIPLPVGFARTTVLTSPHKYKDAREQYEIRTHARLIDIQHLDAAGISKLSALDLPAGVHFKAEIRQ